MLFRGTPGQYLQIGRRWINRDRVALSSDMRSQILCANSSVTENTGRVAIQRGPLVSCMEGLDQTIHPEERNFAGYSVKASGASSASWDASLLGGVTVLEHQGSRKDLPLSSALHYPAGTARTAFAKAALRLIHYYAWANRAPSGM